VKVQPDSLPSSPFPTSGRKSAVNVPELKLSRYGPSYGTRLRIRPEGIWEWERTPPTSTSPGFAGGDILGVFLTPSHENKSKDGKERAMPKILKTPF